MNPLEQFQIVTYVTIKLGSLDISFTNRRMSFRIGIGFFRLFFLGRKRTRVVRPLSQRLSQKRIHFLWNLVRTQTKALEKRNQILTALLSPFFLVFFRNRRGLIPYSFTATRQLRVTLYISFGIFWGFTFYGVSKHKRQFLRHFFPGERPTRIAPLLVPLEGISYWFRPISLAVRLFANMVTGHRLLKILCGFTWQLFTSKRVFLRILRIIARRGVMRVYLLESVVRALQAYVFLILLCIYYSDVRGRLCFKEKKTFLFGGWCLFVGLGLLEEEGFLDRLKRKSFREVLESRFFCDTWCSLL